MTLHDSARHLGTIKAFVEGSLPAQDFAKWLYETPGLPEHLPGDFVLPEYVDEPTLYTFLIAQNYASVESLFNTQTLLSDVLNSQAVVHVKTIRYERLFNLALQAQPTWLMLTAEYLTGALDLQSGDGNKTQLSSLKKKIKDDFRCLKSPPKWLQAPDWPIENGKPLVFIGQLDTSSLNHDTSQVYVFFNQDTQRYFTLNQCC